MLHGFWQSERGFSLMELLFVIIIMGIVFSAASSMWFGAIESRRVDSATNQVVSDLRRAHTSATNRLEDWHVEMDVDSSTYEIGPPAALETRTLLGMEGADAGAPVTDTTLTIVFEPDGSASATPAPPVGSPIAFGVHSLDGCPSDTIEINTVTSRIEVAPNAC